MKNLEVEIWQLIVGFILLMTLTDFIRLLCVKLMAKKFRVFALVGDNDNLRLEYAAFKLGAETTEVVHNIDDDTYYLVTEPSIRYKIRPITGYMLEDVKDIAKKSKNKKKK